MTVVPWKQTLRDGTVNGIRTHLTVEQNDEGALLFFAHDLGLPAGLMSDNSEYEYFRTISAANLDELIELLDGESGDDLQTLLRENWSEEKSFELESRLGQAPFKVEFFSC